MQQDMVHKMKTRKRPALPTVQDLPFDSTPQTFSTRPGRNNNNIQLQMAEAQSTTQGAALGGFAFYASDSGGDSEQDDSRDDPVQPASAAKKQKIDLAPKVNADDLSSFRYLTGPTTKEITHNVPYTDLSKPLMGPQNPFSGSTQTNRNVLSGFIEDHSMSTFTFNTLSRTFSSFGYTVDPDTGTRYVGDAQKVAERN
ncbi:hypothetical protein BDK51DRAFT_28277, partial [Blyttiomyces helicus]